VPSDIEAHVRGDRLRAAAEYGVEDVVVIGDLDVSGAEPSPSAGGVKADRRERDRDRPEQP
jgi:hypothetical protein